MSIESGKHAQKFESAILFIQKEHANTLKDLHEEICRLQKQCSELTFQLTMRDVLTEKPDLEKSSTVIDILERELDHRDKHIKQLEGKVQSYKKLSLDENRKHVQTVNMLCAELKSKTSQITYLTSEVHRFQCLNKKSVNEETDFKQERIPVDSGISAEAKYLYSDSTYLANRFQSTLHFIPKPPSDDILYPISDTSKSTRSGHRRSIIHLEHSRKQPGTHNTSSSSLLLEKQLRPHHLCSDSIGDSKAQDATPFLQHSENVIQMVDVKQVPVLPPISASSSNYAAAKCITPPS
ncbi:unnamed protein product [Candidula unifasciata]|uniref:CCDC92/74 N-terminal domain-containing protein n=1 Tax=Candidula unifasciata TaxID=100452 RepID=A0A8S3Z5R8_9EUPU|nr:unnamed protein product [Candidula unifasciata]